MWKMLKKAFGVVPGRSKLAAPRPGITSEHAVQPMTPLQMRNESDDEVVVFVYGAPPLQEGADFLDDVELPAHD